MFEPFMGQGGGGPGPFGNNQFHFAAGFGLFPSFFGMQFVRHCHFKRLPLRTS